jgi:hypothetical protein
MPLSQGPEKGSPKDFDHTKNVEDTGRFLRALVQYSNVKEGGVALFPALD